MFLYKKLTKSERTDRDKNVLTKITVFDLQLLQITKETWKHQIKTYYDVKILIEYV